MRYRPTPEEFVTYLRGTLIPDLHTSGFDATAEDFETAADIIEELAEKNDDPPRRAVEHRREHNDASDTVSANRREP